MLFNINWRTIPCNFIILFQKVYICCHLLNITLNAPIFWCRWLRDSIELSNIVWEAVLCKTVVKGCWQYSRTPFVSGSQLVGQLSKTVTPHTKKTGMFLLQANFFDYQDRHLFMLVLAQHKVADANRIPPKEHILERIQRHITLFSQFPVNFISILYSMLGLRHGNRGWIEIILFHRLFSLTAQGTH